MIGSRIATGTLPRFAPSPPRPNFPSSGCSRAGPVFKPWLAFCGRFRGEAGGLFAGWFNSFLSRFIYFGTNRRVPVVKTNFQCNCSDGLDLCSRSEHHLELDLIQIAAVVDSAFFFEFTHILFRIEKFSKILVRVPYQHHRVKFQFETSTSPYRTVPLTTSFKSEICILPLDYILLLVGCALARDPSKFSRLDFIKISQAQVDFHLLATDGGCHVTLPQHDLATPASVFCDMIEWSIELWYINMFSNGCDLLS